MKRYPKYKDSGVEWIGDVPEGWEVKRIGSYFNERREKVSDKDFAALSVTKNGIVPQLDTAAKSDDGDNRKKVCRGDFVINSRSDRKGSSGASELDGSVSLICTVLRPQEHVHMPFVHHLLRSQLFQEEFYRNGKGIVADLWSTNYSEMRNILLGIPPFPEQTAIASFLDRETAKMDALVAEQEKLIAILKEKRQAVISHAVTKGLDPSVPMKDSGVEWLGEVPECWTIMRFANVGSLMKANGGSKQDDVDSGVPCIRYGDLYTTYGFLIRKIRKFINPEVEIDYTAIDYGDLLLAASGETFEEIGKSAVNLVNEKACCGGDVIVLRPDQEIDPVFLAYAAGSISAQAQKSLMGKGFTVIHIYRNQLRNLVIAVPPEQEQKVIGEKIENKTTRIDALIAKTQHSIDLLKERRSALISAAVTGKIDVRSILPSHLDQKTMEIA